MIINNNIHTSWGLAKGTRCRVVAWDFPPDTNFVVGVHNGACVRFPVKGSSALRERVQPTCIYVETLSPLLGIPAGQPSGLPPNVVALPMFTLEATIKFNKLYANSRASV